MQIEFAKCQFGEEEKDAVNRVMSTHWLASGKENEAFEREFADYVGVKYAVCCNSGSSANLLALASLGLRKDSWVLTSACGFPATLSPILHLGLKPLLIDYDYKTHNISVNDVIDNLSKVSAVIFAHTMGNPVNMASIIYHAGQLGIPVIEDCCEAVGASYMGFRVGSHGTLGTFSFYPAHQMTALGGGGMVVTNSEELYQRMKSLRDWGKMYDWDSDKGGNQTDYSSPIGYHRGYTYQSVGWNFKLPEANCAFGREQLKKLDSFNQQRRENWVYLYEKLLDVEELYIPVMSAGSAPFGFLMNLKDGDVREFGKYLERCGIKHRPFFAGNILRQPAFKSPDADKFTNADHLMNHSIFIGCWAGMTKEMLDYIVETIHAYFVHS